MNRLSRIRETIPLRPKYAAPLLIFMGHRSPFAAPFPAATRLGVVARCGQEPVRRRQVEDGSRLWERLDVDGPDPKARRAAAYPRASPAASPRQRPPGPRRAARERHAANVGGRSRRPWTLGP